MTIKLVCEHWYKLNDRGDVIIAQYIGRNNDFPCCVCGKGNKAYTFNVWYSETGYETWGFGKEHLPTILEDLGIQDKVIIGE